MEKVDKPCSTLKYIGDNIFPDSSSSPVKSVPQISSNISQYMNIWDLIWFRIGLINIA